MMDIDGNVKIYFKNEQWDKLSELEKARYRNAYIMYQECLLQGIVLPEPDFMISNKENGCETVDKGNDIPVIDYKQEDPLPINMDICMVQCPFCSIYLTDKKYLENHIGYCRNKFSGEADYSDDNSSEKDTDSNSQMNHSGEFGDYIRTATGIKTYQCTVCNRKFAHRSSLKRHLIIHTEEKPFHCNDCDYTCNFKQNLRDHIKDKHTKEKAFSCEFCSYKTVRKTNLVHHLRTHSKERPFICNICNKTFSRNSSLTCHMNIHLDVRFHCSKCNYVAHQKLNLQRHYKREHTSL